MLKFTEDRNVRRNRIASKYMKIIILSFDESQIGACCVVSIVCVIKY